MSTSLTCLVALRADVGNLAHEMEEKLKKRIGEVEQAFSSMGWELDTARDNLKVKDDRNEELFVRLQEAEKKLQASEAEERRLQALLGSVQESNAALVDRIGHAEEAYTQLERSSNAKIEALQACVAACITPQQAVDQINKVHDELMDKLSAERKELELTQKLLQQSRDERDAARSERDLARNAGQQVINERDTLASELEKQKKFNKSSIQHNTALRDLNQAQGARIAELKAVGPALDILATMVKELEAKLEACTVTAEEMFVKFKPFVYDLLKCIYNMTSPAVSALQYGNHHGHQTLHKHIVRYRRFVDEMGRKNHTSYSNDVPDEVLRDNEG